MNFKSLIEQRRSIQKFRLDKRPDWRKIIRAIDTARFIPRAGKSFHLKYLMIEDKDIIYQIGQAAQQDFVAQAPYLVVVINDETHLEKMFGERGRRYGAQMAGASIENFLLALTENGLATTWVGHFHDDMVKGLLSIPAHTIIEAIFPIGIEAKNNKTQATKKTELDNMLYFEKWGNTEMQPNSIATNP